MTEEFVSFCKMWVNSQASSSAVLAMLLDFGCIYVSALLSDSLCPVHLYTHIIYPCSVTCRSSSTVQSSFPVVFPSIFPCVMFCLSVFTKDLDFIQINVTRVCPRLRGLSGYQSRKKPVLQNQPFSSSTKLEAGSVPWNQWIEMNSTKCAKKKTNEYPARIMPETCSWQKCLVLSDTNISVDVCMYAFDPVWSGENPK